MDILLGILAGIGLAALIYGLYWVSWKLGPRG